MIPGREIRTHQTVPEKSVSVEGTLFALACAVLLGFGAALFMSAPPGAPAGSAVPAAPGPSAPRAQQSLNADPANIANPVRPSFDCNTVRSAVLTLVCKTPALAALDQQLAAVYRQALTASSNPNSVKRDERLWIAARNNASADVETVTSFYTTKISELKAIVSQAGSTPDGAAAATDPTSQAMTFRYRGTTKLEAAMDFDFRFIYAEGEITDGTAARFASFLDANSITPGAVVIFDSPGGLVSEALKLGEEIRGAGLSTSVKSPNAGSNGKPTDPIAGCFSACALAFLGGVQRTVPANALFGVHQLSTSTSLTSAQALQFAQSAMGAIDAYASEMGVKSQFLYQLTRATSDGINLLSPYQLDEHNVTTPEFRTAWNVQPIDGRFYLVSSTETHGGLDKMAVNCGVAGPELVFMFNTTGRYMQDTLDDTTDYGLEFDNAHMDLLPAEIVQPVKKLDDRYVITVISLSSRIAHELQSAKSVTFEMMAPSHATYSGWKMDFANGRDLFTSFLKSCGAPADTSSTESQPAAH